MNRATMPIMGAILLSEIPFAMIQPHEAQALRNHGQTLERLAQRGGLAASEAVAIMKGLCWSAVKTGVPTEHYLINMVREWRAAQPQGNV
ncbi:hypothetical protein LMG26846_01965 [Achromobacter insuavis]|uniref:hypothetical protein n=1 Tax=Achromobacter insuavis TaxID=1287735 RepID=UPI001468A9D6|nr:hypothetical protein [Achromobacter insuavis]CAB3850444.1 hypothetical protein LMG26846_01965 [Achromobacter insuavis]